MELTLQQLKDMKPGKIFATGTGMFPILFHDEIRWIAKRGDGFHDWCIYYHLSYADIEFIAKNGDKCFTEPVIKKLIPCTDEAYGLYRF